MCVVSHPCVVAKSSDTYISEVMSDEDYLEWESRAFLETHELPETDAVNP